jgi:dTDP-glucose 4,6-dehydratase
VLESGAPGETYNIGASSERTNMEVVTSVCALLDELRPRAQGSYREQIAFVQDRPGHDRRYAMDAGKLVKQLGWKPAETFETGLRKTVQWYLDHSDWVAHVQAGAGTSGLKTQYRETVA